MGRRALSLLLVPCLAIAGGCTVSNMASDGGSLVTDSGADGAIGTGQDATAGADGTIGTGQDATAGPDVVNPEGGPWLDSGDGTMTQMEAAAVGDSGPDALDLGIDGGDSAAAQGDGGIGCINGTWCFHDPYPSRMSVVAVAGTSPDDLWFIDSAAAAPSLTVFHLSSGAWTAYSLGSVGGIFALTPTDVWLTSGTSMLHFDGQSWHSSPTPSTSTLRSVRASAPADVWAVGDGGNIVHYDGTSWTAVNAGTQADLTSVLAFASSDVWIGGAALGFADIRHWDGQTWTQPAHPMLLSVNDMCGASPSDFWVLGDSTLHFTGSFSNVPNSFGPLTTCAAASTSQVLFIPANFGGRAGMRSVTPWWDGTAMNTAVIDTYASGNVSLSPIGGGKFVIGTTGGTETLGAYVGDQNGATPVTTLFAEAAHPLSVQAMIPVSSATEAYAIISGGLWHASQPGHWLTVSLPMSTAPVTGYATGPTNVWVVGNVGMACGFDGTQWTCQNVGVGYTLTAVWSSAPNDVWSADGMGHLLHFDGQTWTLLPAPAAGPATYLTGSTRNDVWYATGTQVFHYSGTSWVNTPLQASSAVGSIGAFAPNDAWLATGDGQIQHWDGSGWTLVGSAVEESPSGLTPVLGPSIWTSSGEVFVGCATCDPPASAPNSGGNNIAHWKSTGGTPDGGSLQTVNEMLFQNDEPLVFGQFAGTPWVLTGGVAAVTGQGVYFRRP